MLLMKNRQNFFHKYIKQRLTINELIVEWALSRRLLVQYSSYRS